MTTKTDKFKQHTTKLHNQSEQRRGKHETLAISKHKPENIEMHKTKPETNTFRGRRRRYPNCQLIQLVCRTLQVTFKSF